VRHVGLHQVATDAAIGENVFSCDPSSEFVATVASQLPVGPSPVWALSSPQVIPGLFLSRLPAVFYNRCGDTALFG
jgi:hypothetical protein